MARITQARWESQMRARMAAENKRDQLLARASATRRGQCDIEGRMRAEALQRKNVSARLAAQTLFDDQLRTTDAQKREQERDHDQAEKLAKAIGDRKREQERWEMEITRICEKDPSLRALQSQLNAAYMNQERAAQSKEKKFLTHLQKDRIAQIDAQMEKDRQLAVQEMSEAEQRRRHANREAQTVLDRQIESKARAAAEDGRRQFLDDQAMVDAIVSKVQTEDDEASRARKEKQEATRRFIQDFQTQQQDYKLEQKRKEEQEALKIRKYNEATLAREKGVAEKKAAKKAEEDRIFKQLEDQAMLERKEKEEFEQMRELLWQEEMERQMQDQEEARAERQTAMKREMIKANEYQKEIKAAQRERERVEEEEARRKMMQKFEEDEVRAREAAAERLRNKEAYIREINAQRSHRRELYDRDVEAQKQELKKMQDEEEFRQMVVEEARQRLLREHATKLQGFLPRGVLQKRSDMELLTPST